MSSFHIQLLLVGRAGLNLLSQESVGRIKKPPAGLASFFSSFSSVIPVLHTADPDFLTGKRDARVRTESRTSRPGITEYSTTTGQKGVKTVGGK